MAKIMLVEDDNNLREIYGARLMAEGYDIVSAQDGEEALAIAVKEKPDLIISDVMMPRISGFDMLDILRNAPETKDTKVIMMTALSQAEDKSRADKLGADRYLVKSQVTLEDVTNVVHDVLGDAPSDSTASTETPTVTSSSAAPQAGAEAPAPVSTPVAESTPAPTVEAIANPDIKVVGDPNPGEVQAPPAPVSTPVAESTPAPTAPSVPQPVIPAPNPAQFQPQTPPLATPVDDNASQSATATSDDQSITPLNTSTTTPPVTDDSTSSLPPIVDPVKKEEVKPEDIKVELPAPTTPEQTTAQATPITPESTPVQPPSSSEPSVGPNLAEALAAEEEQSSSPTAEDTATTAPAIPSAPTVANGSPAPTVVTPTKIEVTTPQEETTPPTPESDNPSTPDKKAIGERVIQPITNPSDKPDLQALLAVEEQNEAVNNPVANSVIAPQGQTETPESTQKPSTDLNNIAI